MHPDSAYNTKMILTNVLVKQNLVTLSDIFYRSHAQIIYVSVRNGSGYVKKVYENQQTQ